MIRTVKERRLYCKTKLVNDPNLKGGHHEKSNSNNFSLNNIFQYGKLFKITK